jgi:hypothetical protein
MPKKIRKIQKIKIKFQAYERFKIDQGRQRN